MFMQDYIKTLEEKSNNNIIKYSDIVKSNLPSSSSTASHNYIFLLIQTFYCNQKYFTCQ